MCVCVSSPATVDGGDGWFLLVHFPTSWYWRPHVTNRSLTWPVYLSTLYTLPTPVPGYRVASKVLTWYWLSSSRPWVAHAKIWRSTTHVTAQSLLHSGKMWWRQHLRVTYWQSFSPVSLLDKVIRLLPSWSFSCASYTKWRLPTSIPEFYINPLQSQLVSVAHFFVVVMRSHLPSRGDSIFVRKVPS